MTYHSRFLLVSFLLTFLLGIGYALNISAQEPTTFNIPPQPLSSALLQFSDATNLELLFDAEMARGLRSPGVAGAYSPEEALRILLTDSGVTYRFTSAGTIALERAGPASVPATRTQQPALSEPAAASDSRPANPVKLPEIIVKEIREREDAKTYVAEEATTATRTDTPIRDIPQSIQVITRKVIEEQRALRLDDVLQNVSGVVTQAQSADVNDAFLIRGFPATNNNFFRDGLFDPVAAQVASDPYNIQRLEVLKGPAAVLYGLGDPGGIINLITRKPLPNAAYSGLVTLGNYNLHRSVLDATGLLNAGKRCSIGCRSSAKKRQLHGFCQQRCDGDSAVRHLVDGVSHHADCGWRIFSTLDPADPRTPAEGTVLPNINGEIPRNRFSGFGDFGFNNRTLYRIGYDLTHQFNNNWSLRNMYRFTIQKIDQI
ncbi:MAG TPA: TonB-dependent receptor plug domain-containing protein [Nitrospiraceae bacterium]|nr:TonB-dependent receptor plug domain-containing protein [Nitrospiraceae bacterium]